MNYFINKVSIVNEGQIYEASVLIQNGKIEQIFPSGIIPDADFQIIEGEGLYLLPGIIDTHVHFREPGLTYKGDIESESKAAVAGGVTSFIDMPNTNPQTITEKDLDDKIRLASQKAWANFGFMIGATNENISNLLQISYEKVAGIKLFLGSSTGNMLVDDENEMSRLFNESEKIIVAHCEDEQMIRTHSEEVREKYGSDAPSDCHPLIRSTQACIAATSKAMAMVKNKKAHLHIAHVSTQEEMALIKQAGLKNVTSELCANYLWFDATDYQTMNNKIKCNPAIKSAENKEALLHALAEADTIATDHAPHTLQEKEQPYFLAPSGIPGVQHGLAIMLELRAKGFISLEAIVEKMCHNPATLFGIKNRGFIREGYFADVVLVDLQDKQTVSKGTLLYKCGWSPLEGTTFHSLIRATFVNGNKVYEDGIFSTPVTGMPLVFERGEKKSY